MGLGRNLLSGVVVSGLAVAGCAIYEILTDETVASKVRGAYKKVDNYFKTSNSADGFGDLFGGGMGMPDASQFTMPTKDPFTTDGIFGNNAESAWGSSDDFPFKRTDDCESFTKDVDSFDLDEDDFVDYEDDEVNWEEEVDN